MTGRYSRRLQQQEMTITLLQDQVMTLKAHNKEKDIEIKRIQGELEMELGKRQQMERNMENVQEVMKMLRKIVIRWEAHLAEKEKRRAAFLASQQQQQND